MTYSEVVALLSSHMVPNEEGNQVPMLEKFVNMENNFSGFKAYGQSKLGNILVTNELANKLKGNLL